MAAAGGELAAGAGGVAKAGEGDGVDDLAVGAAEVGLRLDVAGDDGADVVPPHGDNDDLLRIPAGLLEDDHEVAGGLHERPRDMIPEPAPADQELEQIESSKAGKMLEKTSEVAYMD